ncbi:MAG: flagellar motor protein MotB [Acidimicrobiales bacterium]|jgi:chemotaxis protein MotB
MRTGRPYRAVSSTEEGGEEEPAGMERWLLTYSDMITLLLALFVVLYALGSLNHVKYSEFAKGMNVSFNNGNSQPSSARTQPSKHPGDNPVEKYAASLGSVEAQLRGALIKAGLMKDVQLTVGPGGLVVGLITGRTYYGVDSAALSPLGAEVVDITGQVIRSHTNPVNVEGYTDNEPITGGPYRDNWQLSAERAVVVVERLQDVAHVNPAQLYIVGLGQYHPIVPNSSTANQARNRRVNIVITVPGQKVALP